MNAFLRALSHHWLPSSTCQRRTFSTLLHVVPPKLLSFQIFIDLLSRESREPKVRGRGPRPGFCMDVIGCHYDI